MLKKLFISAAAAAAVSVPLAGVAWATPSDNNPPGQPGPGATGPGIPHAAGAFGDSVNQNPNGPGERVPPGQEFNIAKDAFPGAPIPVAVGQFVNGVYASVGVPTQFGPTPPGLATKTFTPGCKSGHTEHRDTAAVGSGICN